MTTPPDLDPDVLARNVFVLTVLGVAAFAVAAYLIIA